MNLITIKSSLVCIAILSTNSLMAADAVHNKPLSPDTNTSITTTTKQANTPDVPKVSENEDAFIIDQYVNYVSALSVKKLCNDYEMLTSATLSYKTCRTQTQKYLADCNREQTAKINQMTATQPTLRELDNFGTAYQVIWYKYCLVEHARNDPQKL